MLLNTVKLHSASNACLFFFSLFVCFCFFFAATEPTEVRKTDSALLITLGFDTVESNARTFVLHLYLQLCSKVFSAQPCIRVYLKLIPHFILHLPF